MRTEQGQIPGQTVVDELRVDGICTGSLVVESGGVLHLHGMCEGIVVREGGIAFIYGTCVGNAVNEGGVIEVYGVVTGKLDQSGGTTVVHTDAVIKSMD
jgi:hypothetical protein